MGARLLAVVLAVCFGLLVVFLPRAMAWAQGEHCDGARVVVDGGQPSPFILPDHEGATLRIQPDAVLLIRAENVPADPSVRWSVAGLGADIAAVSRDMSSGAVQVDVADFSAHVRGLFKIKGTLLTGETEVCTVALRLQVEGFGGTAGMASAAASAVEVLGSLASAPFAASGTNAKLTLKVKLQRRRPRGWRRFLPVPAWKRTITGTVVGAFTGLCVTVLLQQAGVTPLSLATAIWGLIVGGGVTLGAGYSLGALWTYVRSPVEPAQTSDDEPPVAPAEEPRDTPAQEPPDAEADEPHPAPSDEPPSQTREGTPD